MIVRRIVLLIITVLLFAFAHPAEAAQNANAKSLSPYFFVENGDENNEEAFPLLETKVDAEISGVIAKVTVTQRYANRGKSAIHARYIFPGSTWAAVHGLTMTIGERTIRAEIKEKQEARRIHETARREGKSTTLLEQKRPNVFSMEVANILPGDTIDVKLEYSELLVPEDGTYEFVYPTVVGPRYSGKTQDESTDNQWVANPYLKTGNDPQSAFSINVRLAAGLAVREAACHTHPVKIAYDSPDIARVSLDTTDFTGNRDYILRYRLAGQEIVSGLMLFEGADENFFLLMAQPPARPKREQIPGREYIFVVDVSGSMHGFPLDTTKVLLKNLMARLRPADKFNMLFFSGSNKLMAPASIPATPQNLERALTMLGNFEGSGGTELLPALHRAMALKTEANVSRSLVVITDGYIDAEKEAFALIRDNLNKNNLFAFGVGSSVNRHLIEGLAKAGRGEPFILTNPGESHSVAKKFSDYIAAPVLTNVTVTSSGFDIYDQEPAKIADLFASRPLLVYGKWRGERKGSITLSGTSGAGQWSQSFALSAVKPDRANAGLRYLWARERLAQISDYSGFRGEETSREDVVALGLKYNLLTAHTSFVAVDNIVRNPGGDGKHTAQPLPLPMGVSERAVGVPEPEFWLLLVLSLALLAHLLPERRIALQRATGRFFQ
ncbi:VIT and VWA domain-containing protein [Desulfovibrio sp. OttesenSCG-928-O18]|nr:VIT and VWA domain-containing protein [Desulfovibrio sp. OttesenSCG-928-O18]